MKLKTTLLATSLLSMPASASVETRIMRTNVNPITLIADGNNLAGGWTINPKLSIDEFKTIARTVTFASDIDTLTIQLEEWESRDFGIVTENGDTAFVRVTREAANPFESPHPKLKIIAPSGLLSRKQSEFDIDALIYTLTEIHPDVFSICKQTDFMRAVNEAKQTLPDSVSALEFYRRAAPIVAMIGDGHTKFFFPFNHVFTKDIKRIPVFFNVWPGKILTCSSSLDALIPTGAHILSINGHTAEEILTSMLPYISGEREHFKLSQLNTLFTAYFQMLYAADSYTVRYTAEGSKKTQEVSVQAMLWEDFINRIPSNKKDDNTNNLPYSFSIDKDKGVAILDFKACNDRNKMKTFADSLFRTLHNEGIDNLIIDVRKNGGGSSAVGDVLLRYITPEPFVQMDRALMKVTPLTVKLSENPNIKPGIRFAERSPESFIQPVSAEEGHYKGNVYLLTSNRTFSAANSFAWTFKMCGIGRIIGEETGGMNVSYGDYLTYRLPISGLACGISYKRFWQLRANENEIHGTIPDIKVPETEALTTALKLIKKNKKRSKKIR